MFLLDKHLLKLDIAASRLLKLFRSMRDVQIALPGFPSQEACAYLCQYQGQQAIATVAVFHLQRSDTLAFYCSDPAEVTPGKADAQMEQGLNFVESMGFLLSDMDIELMSEADRSMLWESLPLFCGSSSETAANLPQVEPAEQTSKKKTAGTAVTAKRSQPTEVPEKAADQAETAAPRTTLSEERVDEPEGVDELLAAVQSLRAGRSGVPVRKKQLSPTEMKQRRLVFRENIGRILASL